MADAVLASPLGWIVTGIVWFVVGVLLVGYLIGSGEKGPSQASPKPGEPERDQ